MTEQKQEYITDALSELEDAFLEEAIAYKKSHRGIGRREWASLGAFAAVLVLCVTTYMQLPMRERDNSTEAMSGAEGAMPESALAESFREEGNAEGIKEEGIKEESIKEEGVKEEGFKEEGIRDESFREESDGKEHGRLESALGESSKEEALENPIGITAQAAEVTATGMQLLLIQEGGAVTGTLQTGEYYWLEREINGEWVRLQQQYDVIKEVAYVIEPNGTAVLRIDWEGMYGVLESGIYRLGKSIDDFREAGDYDSYEVYAQFVIEEEEGG